MVFFTRQFTAFESFETFACWGSLPSYGVILAGCHQAVFFWPPNQCLGQQISVFASPWLLCASRTDSETGQFCWPKPKSCRHCLSYRVQASCCPFNPEMAGPSQQSSGSSDLRPGNLVPQGPCAFTNHNALDNIIWPGLPEKSRRPFAKCYPLGLINKHPENA